MLLAKTLLTTAALAATALLTPPAAASSTSHPKSPTSRASARPTTTWSAWSNSSVARPRLVTR